MDRIKPCPFCGFDGGNECLPVKTDEYFTYYAVACADCFARGPRNSRPEKAIEKWNSLLRRDEYERLQEDFDAAARGAADESVKAVELEEEADWLARQLTKIEDIPCPEHPCSRSGKDGCLQCWREAAHRAVESKPDLFDHLAEHPDTKLAPEG